MIGTLCLCAFLGAIFAAVFCGRFFDVARFAAFLREGLARFEAFLRVCFALAMTVSSEVCRPVESTQPTLSLSLRHAAVLRFMRSVGLIE